MKTKNKADIESNMMQGKKIAGAISAIVIFFPKLKWRQS